MAIEGETVVVGASQNDDIGFSSGSAYVFRRIAGAWVETQKLTPSVSADLDSFGADVALDRDVIVVGAGKGDGAATDSGTAFVFRFDGSSWQEEAMLAPADGLKGDGFGTALALADDLLVVGARYHSVQPGDWVGAVYVFRFQGGSWVEQQEMLPPDPQRFDFFGFSVATDGQRILAGVPQRNSGSGLIYEFHFDGTLWQPEIAFAAEHRTENSFLGGQVALGGDFVLAGSNSADKDWADRIGEAFVFSSEAGLTLSSNLKVANVGSPFSISTCGGLAGAPVLLATIELRDLPVFIVLAIASFDAEGNWTLGGTVPPGLAGHFADFQAFGIERSSQKLRASNVLELIFPFNETERLMALGLGADDRFGTSVSVHNGVAIVGSPGENTGRTLHGAARVFRFDGLRWNEEQRLLALDGADRDEFGSSVLACGAEAFVGAPQEDVTVGGSGAVYWFHFDGSAWVESQKLVASDPGPSAAFGTSIAKSGELLVVGAPLASAYVGAAYVFRFDGVRWNEIQKLSASSPDHRDDFGTSVAVEGDWLMVGAPYDDDLGNASGAVHVFRFDGTSFAEETKLMAFDSRRPNSFGFSVSLCGDRLLVGERDSYDFGAAYIFRFDGSGWIPEQRLTTPDTGNADHFGYSLALTKDLAVVAAVGASYGGDSSGCVHRYRYDGAGWVGPQRLVASDDDARDLFGFAVAADQDVILVGAAFDDGAGVDAGAAYVFDSGS